MTTPGRQEGMDFTAAPRAVLATAADLIFLVGRSVFGADRIPTAQSNAWAAVCADRERAKVRAELTGVRLNGHRDKAAD